MSTSDDDTEDEEEFEEMSKELPDIANEDVALTGHDLNDIINSFGVLSYSCSLEEFDFNIPIDSVCNVLCIKGDEAHWIMFINHGSFYSYLDTYGRSLEELYQHFLGIKAFKIEMECYPISQAIQNDYSVVCGYYSIICSFMCMLYKFDFTDVEQAWKKSFISIENSDNKNQYSVYNDMLCLMFIHSIIPSDVNRKVSLINKHIDNL